MLGFRLVHGKANHLVTLSLQELSLYQLNTMREAGASKGNNIPRGKTSPQEHSFSWHCFHHFWKCSSLIQQPPCLSTMANSLQDVKLLITDINTSTPSRDRQINGRAETIINNLLLLYFGFSLGGNFNSFEIKQRITLYNHRF